MATITGNVISEAVQQPASESVRLFAALRHLNSLLPLKKHQLSLPPTVVTVHRAILRSLAEKGRPLRRSEVAAMLGSEAAAVHALAELATNDLVVLNTAVSRDKTTHSFVVQNPAGMEVVGAYPMTTEKTPHRVNIFGHSISAMCALDALAIGIMFNTETTIESRCQVSGAPIVIHQNGKSIHSVSPSPDVRVGIHWQATKGCAAHGLCTEMVFLKDAATAAAWRNQDPKSIELFNLTEALEFAEAFFVPIIRDDFA